MTNKLRILLVINGMHPRHGGPPQVIAGSAVALQKMGHQVMVCSLLRQGEERIVRETWKEMLRCGVEVTFCKDENLKSLLGFPAQKTFFEKLLRNCDVVHIHGVWCAMYLVLARLAHKIGRPYFVSSHGLFDHRAMKREIHKNIKKRIAIRLFDIGGYLEKSAGVIFGSEAELTESWLPSKNIPICIVPNGVDKRLGTKPPTSMELKSLMSVSPAQANWKRTILCRSRIHEEKGQDMLIAAFNMVAKDFPGTGLLIAALKQVDHFEVKLRKMISESPFRDRIVMTTELIGPANQFVSKVATIYATPSIAEGFSMSLLEGLANGKPMLVTRFCHMPQVEDCGAGVVVESNTAAIAMGLRTLLSMDESKLTEMGNAARQLFEQNYTWEIVGEQLAQRYRTALSTVIT